MLTIPGSGGKPGGSAAVDPGEPRRSNHFQSLPTFSPMWALVRRVHSLRPMAHPLKRPRTFGLDRLDLPGGAVVDLHEELGRGARAVVRRGRLRTGSGLARTVAVKLYGAVGADDGDAIRDTLDEQAQLVADMGHPAIASILDVGVSDGRPYVLREWIPGAQSVAQILAARRRLPLDAALLIVLATVDAVACAHDIDYVHGDLSGRQVLISEHGDVKVTDFGESTAFPSTSRVQRAMTLSQRLAHVAPELVRGKAPKASSDVFALGILLFELVQGPRFADGLPHEALLAAVRAGNVVRPILAPVLPEEIATVLHRAVSCRTEDRHQDARELSADLRRAMLTLGLPDARAFIAGARIKDADLARTTEAPTPNFA